MIAYESGVAKTVDPLGGCYFVERLTLDMENGAFDYFEKLDVPVAGFTSQATQRPSSHDGVCATCTRTSSPAPRDAPTVSTVSTVDCLPNALRVCWVTGTGKRAGSRSASTVHLGGGGGGRANLTRSC